jgi:hypothetical protein
MEASAAWLRCPGFPGAPAGHGQQEDRHAPDHLVAVLLPPDFRFVQLFLFFQIECHVLLTPRLRFNVSRFPFPE